jgi:hypothetical protein
MILPQELETRKPKIDYKLRRKLYRQNRLSGMCIYDSAIKAGYSRNTAYAQGKRLDRVGNIRQTLEVMGVTDDVLVDKLREGLGATKRDSIVVYDEKGKRHTDVETVDDYPTRHKYLDTALKLKGHMSGDDKGFGGVSQTVIFQIFQADAEGNEIEDPRTSCAEIQVLENTDSVS